MQQNSRALSAPTGHELCRYLSPRGDQIRSLFHDSVSKAVNGAVCSVLGDFSKLVEGVSAASSFPNQSVLYSNKECFPDRSSTGHLITAVEPELKIPGKVKQKVKHSEFIQSNNCASKFPSLLKSPVNAELSSKNAKGSAKRPWPRELDDVEFQKKRIRLHSETKSYADIDKHSDNSNKTSERLLTDNEWFSFVQQNWPRPRSKRSVPIPSVAEFISTWARKPLSKAERKNICSQCPRPIVEGKTCDTPELDSTLEMLMKNDSTDPKMKVDQSFKFCQNKLLDTFGPLAKMFDLVEQSISSCRPLDNKILRGLIQRAICLLGNANTTLSIERRKAVLVHMKPVFSHIASKEAGPSAEGLLFGEPLIQEMLSIVKAIEIVDGLTVPGTKRGRRSRHKF